MIQERTVSTRLPARAAHRYEHIDAMRAFAVILVVLGHAGLGDIVPGGSGVTIFFAISGFIITHLLLKERGRTGRFDLIGFYTRRLLKIFPPFVAIVAIPTGIYALFHQIDWMLFLSQTLFFFNWIYMVNGDANLLPGSGVVWSLSIEEQFYIGFALIWLFAVRSRHYFKILVVFSFIGILLPLALRFFIAFTNFSHARIYYGTDTRLDAIAVGVLTALLYFRMSANTNESSYKTGLSGFVSRDVTLLAAALLYLSSLGIRDEFFRETLRYSMQSVAASLVILYGLMPPDKLSMIREIFSRVVRTRFLQAIGLASYSIYLVHLTLNSVTGVIAPTLNGPLQVVILVFIGLTAGYFIWWVVERPAERFKRKLSKSREASVSRRVLAEK